MNQKSDGEPETLALTSLLPAKYTSYVRIKHLREQVKELRAQKRCYDRMIKQRLDMIEQLRSMRRKR